MVSQKSELRASRLASLDPERTTSPAPHRRVAAVKRHTPFARNAGDTKTVVAVNGQSAAVGKTITLPSGALVTLQADGSYWYDPHGSFSYLIMPIRLST